MIELSIDGVLATLSVRRAEKKNAFTQAMWAALGDHCAALAADARGARVLLLQGEPGAFCAGADIAEMNAMLAAGGHAFEHNNAVVARAQLTLERLTLPTIAVIDGPCFGGGMGLAAACDFRLASTRSRFAVTPARLGLLYSLEDTRRLVRLAGDARARRLLLRGEPLDAATALAWGLVDELVEPEALPALAGRWAEGLAAQSATSLAGIKLTLSHLADGHAVTEGQVRQAYDAAFAGPDFAEGAAAFIARRPPRF